MYIGTLSFGMNPRIGPAGTDDLAGFSGQFGQYRFYFSLDGFCGAILPLPPFITTAIVGYDKGIIGHDGLLVVVAK